MAAPATPNRPHAGDGPDRRRWERVPATAVPNVKAQLSSGVEITLLDISRGGVQFQSTERLLPGLKVSLRFVTPDGKVDVRGEIVRCSVVQLPGGQMVYQVGVSFQEVLSLEGLAGQVPALIKSQ